MSRLTVRSLRFSRAGREVLRGVDLEHEWGSVLTLLGPSGGGKTTLLWLLAGLLEPDAGHIEFAGDAARDGIGFVFQDGGLWEQLSAQDHLEIVLRASSMSRRDRVARVARVLAETGLSKLAGRRPGKLSGGERQRLALARALVIEPRWLLLDEPTSQLDGPARQELVELLGQHLSRTRAGVILATHQVDLALRLSGRIAVLLDGRIAQVDEPINVYHRPVSLGVARLLGPAFEAPGEDGPRIVRPHEVRFEPDPGGSFSVRACYPANGRWQLELDASGSVALAASDRPVPLASTGRLIEVR